jgi:hypothetical protein
MIKMRKIEINLSTDAEQNTYEKNVNVPTVICHETSIAGNA